MSVLGKRARSVLYAVVNEFIGSGEPVGSRTLAKKYGFDLSAATIRNVLADLEDAGYLAQPHTSAGRVPTEKAFRLFIDALMRVRELSAEETSRIAQWFEDFRPGTETLRETGRFLSNLTGAAAVVVRSRLETRKLLKIRFIPTRPGELLSVIVFTDGTVENRFIPIDAPIGERELERVHNMLEEAIQGRTLTAVRDLFARAADARRDELDALRQLGYSLMSAAIDGAERRLDIVVEGQARLVDRPELAHTDELREVLRALEDRERLVMLIDRMLAAGQVQVFLGEETNAMVGHSVSVVAAPYHDVQGRPGGAIGVIGPTRMDYPAVVPLVGATADAMSAALARTREPGRGGSSSGNS